MGPKTFITCYICSKEFGSRSISFHETKCLERWRTAAKKQPPEKRASTPVKPADWKHSCTATWFCTNCQKTIPTAKRSEHSVGCRSKNRKAVPTKDKPEPLLDAPSQNGPQSQEVSKSEPAIKKGKENKNLSNKVSVQNTRKKNAKKETNASNVCEVIKDVAEKLSKDSEQCRREAVMSKSEELLSKNEAAMDESTTSKRSIRPQTKILRRPTPNLTHPVIQMDSDDSGDSSDKSKEDNPKRLKTSNENTNLEHKPKNFVMYNKYNVDKNTKNGSSKERSHAQQSVIPNPCTSCNRSIAPERLHSHRKGMSFRKSPQSDVKLTSPLKKLGGVEVKQKKEDLKETSVIKVPELKDSESHMSNDDDFKDTEPSCENIDGEIEPFKECYICQDSFRMSRLMIHESQCLQTWRKANNSLSPNQRKLPPRKPEEDNLRMRNSNDPAWTAVQSQLIPCSLCSRTFFPERLPVHQRVCKGKSSPRSLKRASSLREHSASRSESDIESTPLYVPCHICGRNFGSWVIPMHEAQCLRKWRKTNEKFDESYDEDSLKTEDFILSMNEKVSCAVVLGDNAWENHLLQLVPCPRCSRTFFPDRLEVHERSCKGQAVIRRPKSNNGVL